MHHSCVFLLLFIIAGLPATSAFSLSRAAERLHRFAKRNSGGLARDLRVVFQGLAVTDQPGSGSLHRVYCIRPDPFTSLQSGNGSSATPTRVSSGSSSIPSATGGNANQKPKSQFNLVEEYSGSSFFNGWSFWNLPDPTNGNVQFLSQSDAQSNGLISINAQGNAIMRVETTPQVSGNRKSIRITSTSTFTQGIFVLDAVHMPQGCGTWPAFWTNGPNWPNSGEIDIIEGVNDYTNNQATLHTGTGCTLPSGATAQNLGISSNLVGPPNCAALESNNAGCGMQSTSNVTYGAGFNSVGGGVYAMAWDSNGISVHFFPRGSTPQDILNDAPLPQTWGTPMSFWPASSCNPAKFFQNHSIIFDTTLCGDWAGGAWSSSGAPGQVQSCAQRTNFTTCQAFVQNSGASFSNAYWEVASVKVYQTTRTP